jgi:hypothetical protein
MATELGVIVPKGRSVVFPKQCVACFSTKVDGSIRLPGGEDVGKAEVPLCAVCALAYGSWSRRQRRVGVAGAALLVVGLALGWWLASEGALARGTCIALGVGWCIALAGLIVYLNQSFRDLCVVDLGDAFGFDFPSPEYAKAFALANEVPESRIVR